MMIFEGQSEINWGTMTALSKILQLASQDLQTKSVLSDNR